MNVPINRDKWSPSSQRLHVSHYDSRATHYEDIAYRCCKCFASCKFTALAQQTAYEVKKRFVWWTPSLCLPCSDALQRLQAENHEYQAKWDANRSVLASDKLFLQHWLNLLREIPTYGKRRNFSMEKHLLKCLNGAQQ